MILGIDEVGRGPWAGPLVVGAVVLAEGNIEGLTDSKKLSPKRREALNEEILSKALGWGLGWVHSDELDEVGLSEALRLATVRAVEKIKTPYHEIIIDGTINLLSGTSKASFVTSLAKADLLIPSVSAASIIAKVARDNYMAQQAVEYPGYGFDKHVGYGTAAHRAAIESLGLTPLHRRSFAPIASFSGQSKNKPVSDESRRNTASIGKQGEDRAANFLITQGHRIIQRNWRTKFCEIDIISKKDGILYFTEVKYRSSAARGGGVAAITAAKLKQMRFAAEAYLSISAAQLSPSLAVIAIDGDSEPVWLDVE